jgi:UDP-N-acetylenolpyruvoylglucosamine reductase
MNISLEILQQKLSPRIVAHKDITHYFTMRTVAKAEYYFEAETKEELIKAVAVAKEAGIPLFILGGGSNVAVIHDEIKGLVVRNLYQKIELLNQTSEYGEWLISSGYSVSRLAMETAKAGYEGLEYHFGLPGTLGGGIYMNSKWVGKKNLKSTDEMSHISTMQDTESFPKYMGDSLVSATLITRDSVIKEVRQSYFNFAYDYSILQETKEIFLEGVFRLKKMAPEILVQRAKDAQEFRKYTQLVGVPTCGCMFQNISPKEREEKNLPTQSAGYLIDKAGMMKTQIGEFVVSDKHANFITNTGKGKPDDLLKLMNLVKSRVKEKFGVELKEEVIII